MTTVLDTPRAVVGLEHVDNAAKPPGAQSRRGSVLIAPCANMSRTLRDEEDCHEFSRDAVEAMIEEYGKHVESLLDPRAGHSRIEYAYSRLLGSRGNICRLCPTSEMNKLDKKAVQRWSWAETQLRNYLGSRETLPRLIDIAQRVEQGWADSMERYITTLSARLGDCDIPDKLGILKGIDTVGMHLAQREIFELSHTLAIPLENTNAVKLRVRLLALFLTLHRCRFSHAYPAIQSYRRTFRIHDPVAYPWWFVDCRLTERQLNWTYKRMPVENFDWRF
jgi:hypothetical protein